MSNQTKLLLAAVAIMAFLIGAAVNSAKITEVADTTELLNARLLTSDGEEQTTRQNLGNVTLVNFWASWCSPCRREMPLFQAVYEREQNNGFQIIGIAIDDQQETQPFLDSMGITYPILYAEQTGMKLMEISGNEMGAMPYSLLLDAEGRVIDQKLGEIHEPQLTAWAQGLAYSKEEER